MSPPEPSVLPASVDLAPSLTLAAVLTVDARLQDYSDGTVEYLGRLVGVARRLAASMGSAGPILRLQGEFLVRREGRTYGARSLLVPECVADAVRAAFAEHPPRSTRDRVTVHLEFDLWAIREPHAALGYRLQADGRAWVPEPFSSLVAAALTRPVPTAPESAP